MNQIQKIELGCYTTAGFCSIAAPGLASQGWILCSILVAGVGAAAIAGKAYFSSSPKDGI